MRKFLFTLLLLLVCHIGYGQSIDSLFDEFECEQNVDYVKVSPFMMSLGKMFCKHEEGSEIDESHGLGRLFGKREKTFQQ